MEFAKNMLGVLCIVALTVGWLYLAPSLIGAP